MPRKKSFSESILTNPSLPTTKSLWVRTDKSVEMLDQQCWWGMGVFWISVVFMMVMTVFMMMMTMIIMFMESPLTYLSLVTSIYRPMIMYGISHRGSATSSLRKVSELNSVSSFTDRDENLIAVLDKLILYLRLVHSFDYYNTIEYPSEDEMPNRCGIIHARGPDPSGMNPPVKVRLTRYRN